MARVKIDIDIDAALKETGDAVSGAAKGVSKAVDKNVKVDSNCAVTNVASSNGAAGALAALPLIGLALWRARRRRTTKR